MSLMNLGTEINFFIQSLLPQLFSQRLLSLLSKRKNIHDISMYLTLNSLKSLLAQFHTFLCDSIHRLHAGFNVVGDMTVEQPFTRVLRTHLYCLKRRIKRHMLYYHVEILFMFHSTDKPNETLLFLYVKGIFQRNINPWSNTPWHRVSPPPPRDQVSDC